MLEKFVRGIKELQHKVEDGARQIQYHLVPKFFQLMKYEDSWSEGLLKYLLKHLSILQNGSINGEVSFGDPSIKDSHVFFEKRLRDHIFFLTKSVMKLRVIDDEKGVRNTATDIVDTLKKVFDMFRSSLHIWFTKGIHNKKYQEQHNCSDSTEHAKNSSCYRQSEAHAVLFSYRLVEVLINAAIVPINGANNIKEKIEALNFAAERYFAAMCDMRLLWIFNSNSRKFRLLRNGKMNDFHSPPQDLLKFDEIVIGLETANAAGGGAITEDGSKIEEKLTEEVRKMSHIGEGIDYSQAVLHKQLATVFNIQSDISNTQAENQYNAQNVSLKYVPLDVRHASDFHESLKTKMHDKVNVTSQLLSIKSCEGFRRDAIHVRDLSILKQELHKCLLPQKQDGNLLPSYLNRGRFVDAFIAVIFKLKDEVTHSVEYYDLASSLNIILNKAESKITEIKNLPAPEKIERGVNLVLTIPKSFVLQNEDCRSKYSLLDKRCDSNVFSIDLDSPRSYNITMYMLCISKIPLCTEAMIEVVYKEIDTSAQIYKVSSLLEIDQKQQKKAFLNNMKLLDSENPNPYEGHRFMTRFANEQEAEIVVKLKNFYQKRMSQLATERNEMIRRGTATKIELNRIKNEERETYLFLETNLQYFEKPMRSRKNKEWEDKYKTQIENRQPFAPSEKATRKIVVG